MSSLAVALAFASAFRYIDARSSGSQVRFVALVSIPFIRFSVVWAVGDWNFERIRPSSSNRFFDFCFSGFLWSVELFLRIVVGSFMRGLRELLGYPLVAFSESSRVFGIVPNCGCKLGLCWWSSSIVMDAFAYRFRFMLSDQNLAFYVNSVICRWPLIRVNFEQRTGIIRICLFDQIHLRFPIDGVFSLAFVIYPLQNSRFGVPPFGCCC